MNKEINRNNCGSHHRIFGNGMEPRQDGDSERRPGEKPAGLPAIGEIVFRIFTPEKGIHYPEDQKA